MSRIYLPLSVAHVHWKIFLDGEGEKQICSCCKKGFPLQLVLKKEMKKE
jgi:hypothetical protein